MTQTVYLKKGETVIYIEAMKVEEILTNTLIKVPKPQTKSSAYKPTSPTTSKNPGTILVDIKKIMHLFNIEGYLSVDANSGNSSYGTVKAVKDALIKNILYPEGDIEFYYRNNVDSDYGNFYGDGTSGASTSYIKTQLEKVSISDEALRPDVSGSTQGVVRYRISLNLVRGKVK